MSKNKSIIIIFFIFILTLLLISLQDREKSLTVHFDSNGGSSCSSVVFVEGQEFIFPEEPTRKNFVFEGWYLDNNTFNQKFDTNYLISLDLNKSMKIKVYAKWSFCAEINFVTNGGSEILDYDYSNQTLPQPTKTNYTFAGWYLDNYTFNKKFDFNGNFEVINNKIVLYAKWNIISGINYKTIYYKSTNNEYEQQFLCKYDLLDEINSLHLYKPEIIGLEFQGWYLDDDYISKLENIVNFNDFDSNIIYIYGKFLQKEVESLKLFGQIKDKYNYGEEVDFNDAYVKISYVNKSYEDEFVLLSLNNTSGFTSVDENNGYDLINITQYNDYTFKSYIVFEINEKQLLIPYYVYSDLKEFSINQENLMFVHGDSWDLSKKEIYASWIDNAGNNGVTKLENKYKDYQSTGINKTENNYLLINFKTSNYGNFEAYLRFRFRVIKINYSVTPISPIKAVVAENEKIFLNSDESLLYKTLKVYFSQNEDDFVLWGYFKSNDIIKDINTTKSGWQVANVLYNGQDIEVDYFVINVFDIYKCSIQYMDSVPKDYVIESGVSIQFYLEDYSFSDVVLIDDFITLIDTSSTGKKVAEFTYKNCKFMLEYDVV